MKQHGTYDMKVTGTTRTIRWSRVVSCKTCSFTVFYEKKISQKKKKERMTAGWTDISGPGPVSFQIHILHYADSI